MGYFTALFPTPILKTTAQSWVVVFNCKNLLLTSGAGSSNIIIHRVAYSVLTPLNGVEKLNRHTRIPLYLTKGQFVGYDGFFVL